PRFLELSACCVLSGNGLLAVNRSTESLSVGPGFKLFLARDENAQIPESQGFRKLGEPFFWGHGGGVAGGDDHDLASRSPSAPRIWFSTSRRTWSFRGFRIECFWPKPSVRAGNETVMSPDRVLRTVMPSMR